MSDWPEQSRPIFEGLRSAAGEALVLEKNVFVERILPASISRELDDDEMAAYRAPFTEAGEARRPTLTWPRELPLDGQPADVDAIVAAYAEWLSHCDLPKLFVNARPGRLLVGAQRDFCRAWPNQLEVTVPASISSREDSGPAIARRSKAGLPGSTESGGRPCPGAHWTSPRGLG